MALKTFIKDLQNVKEKISNKPTKHLTETEKLLKFIEEHIKDKDITITLKTKLNENNGMFVYANWLYAWFVEKNGNLKHIDATYCFKVENFLFFQSSCQNENLNGVLVAYSSM